MDPLSQYEYLLTARGRVLDAVQQLTPEQYQQELPFGLHSIRRTLQHMAGAEWWLLGHLGESPSAADYPFTSTRVPDFAALRREWAAVQGRSREILRRESDWDRSLEVVLTTPARKRYRAVASPLKVFTGFCYHEIHHRAQVMMMLRHYGVPVESLDFLLLTGEVTEEP